MSRTARLGRCSRGSGSSRCVVRRQGTCLHASLISYVSRWGCISGHPKFTRGQSERSSEIPEIECSDEAGEYTEKPRSFSLQARQCKITTELPPTMAPGCSTLADLNSRKTGKMNFSFYRECAMNGIIEAIRDLRGLSNLRCF